MPISLTVDSPPEQVLAMAQILARYHHAWGALEVDDFVGDAVLCFYRKREIVHRRARDFHDLMVWHMSGVMREQNRQEARQHGYERIRNELPVVQDSASFASPRTGGRSASSPTAEAQHRRRVAQREHNKTYYYRHVGLTTCGVCGTQVIRGHGAKRCDAHTSAQALQKRRWRDARKAVA